jgi:hypothetical protein
MYAGGRCPRAAIIHRDSELDRLRSQSDLDKFKNVFITMNLSYEIIMGSGGVILQTENNKFFFDTKGKFTSKERKV